MIGKGFKDRKCSICVKSTNSVSLPGFRAEYSLTNWSTTYRTSIHSIRTNLIVYPARPTCFFPICDENGCSCPDLEMSRKIGQTPPRNPFGQWYRRPNPLIFAADEELYEVTC